jgi:hypothetical protein
MAEPITALTPAPIIGVTAPTSFSLPPGPPQHDVIERLPEERKDLFRKICQHVDDACALSVPFETVREASMEKVGAENELKRRTSHPQDGGFGLKPDDRSVISATKDVEKATANLRRVQQLQAERAAAQQAALRVKAACEDWLRYGVPANCQIEAIEVEPPKLAKNEPGLLDAIENRRRRWRELRANLHRIASAPFPSSHAKAKMRQQIEALAMQGAPSVSRLVELDGPVEFQNHRLSSEVHGERRSLAFTEVPDAVALVAWLHKDALIAALDREIASEADDKSALSHEARQTAEAETMGDLLDIERQEAALVWQAQAQGLPIEHRADISPLALLGVRLVTIPRTTELPETSPGYSWPWRR